MRIIYVGVIILLMTIAESGCGGGSLGGHIGNVVSASPASEGSILTPEKSLVATPDEDYPNGAFCRIFHRPSTNRYVVTFNSGLPENPYYAYKEYSSDLKQIVTSGTFRNRFGGDYAAVMVGNEYFLLTGGPGGWELEKYRADWSLDASRSISLDQSVEKNNDMMLAYVNGQLDASSLYHDISIEGSEEGTHHRFYTTDLEYLDALVLEDERHVNGSSMLYVKGKYHLFSSDGWLGYLKALHYDENWNYLGQDLLTGGKGRWPQGSVFHNGIYYVAYVSEFINRDDPGGIRVAVLDEEWNLIEIIRVFDCPDSATFADRPWLLAHNGKLFVSYDVATFSEPGHVENRDWSCRFKVYAFSG